MTTFSGEIRREQGFQVYVLRSTAVELAVVPELGARILSMKNLRSGREWVWHPEGGLKLFRNHLGDDFSASTLVGGDECLPTIAPCAWQGRSLPDHGEVWSAAWQVDESAWTGGVLKTSIDLPVSPFKLQRAIDLRGNTIRLNYLLTNLSSTEERFLWAFHLLLRLEADDLLDLPDTTRAQFKGKAWIDAPGSTVPQGGCAKLFAGPLTDGRATVYNPKSADRLVFEWDPKENDTLGLWLTRGGWHHHHHFAIEPTNGATDALGEAAGQNRCGKIAPLNSKAWSVLLRVE